MQRERAPRLRPHQLRRAREHLHRREPADAVGAVEAEHRLRVVAQAEALAPPQHPRPAHVGARARPLPHRKDVEPDAAARRRVGRRRERRDELPPPRAPAVRHVDVGRADDAERQPVLLLAHRAQVGVAAARRRRVRPHEPLDDLRRAPPPAVVLVAELHQPAQRHAARVQRLRRLLRVGLGRADGVDVLLPHAPRPHPLAPLAPAKRRPPRRLDRHRDGALGAVDAARHLPAEREVQHRRRVGLAGRRDRPALGRLGDLARKLGGKVAVAVGQQVLGREHPRLQLLRRQPHRAHQVVARERVLVPQLQQQALLGERQQHALVLEALLPLRPEALPDDARRPHRLRAQLYLDVRVRLAVGVGGPQVLRAPHHQRQRALVAQPLDAAALLVLRVAQLVAHVVAQRPLGPLRVHELGRQRVGRPDRHARPARAHRVDERVRARAQRPVRAVDELLLWLRRQPAQGQGGGAAPSAQQQVLGAGSEALGAAESALAIALAAAEGARGALALRRGRPGGFKGLEDGAFGERPGGRPAAAGGHRAVIEGFPAEPEGH